MGPPQEKAMDGISAARPSSRSERPITGRQRGDCVQGYICLLCISGMLRRPYPKNKAMSMTRHMRKDHTNVFPSQRGAALDAIDIADCVVSSSHRTIASLALYDVDTTWGQFRMDPNHNKIVVLTLHQTDMLYHVAR